MTTLALGSIQVSPLSLNWRRISALSGSFTAHIALVLLLLIPPVALELQRAVVHHDDQMTWVIHDKPVVTDEPPLPVPVHVVKQKVNLSKPQKPVITMEAPTALDVPTSSDIPVDAGNHAATGQATGAADIGGETAPSAMGYGTQTKIPYPRMAVLNREQGTVMLKVFVGVDGKPQQVEIDHSSGSHALDVAARDAVKHWTFKPGMRGGMAYAAWALVPVTFTLP